MIQLIPDEVPLFYEPKKGKNKASVIVIVFDK